MKITFLGTGPSGRIPRPNCQWYVCKEAEKPGSKSARLQSSAFFEFPNFNVLVDVTQDFKKQIKRIGGKKINFIFLTHGHSDAAGGLPQLSKNIRQNNASTTVYAEKQTLKTTIKEMPKLDLPLKYLTPYEEYNFKDFKLVPFRVEHSFNPKFPTLGYLFKIRGKQIVYASDFKQIPLKTKKLIKNADLAILDCAAYKHAIPTHMSFPEILELAKEMKFKKIYLTQVGIAWPHYEMAREIVNKQAKNISLAYDGLSMWFV